MRRRRAKDAGAALGGTAQRPATALRVQVLQLAALEIEPAIVAVARLAAAILGVADAAAARAHAVEERVLLAVDAYLDEIEALARGLALLPQLVARSAPEDRRPPLDGGLQRLLIGVGDQDHLAGIDVLHRHRQDVRTRAGHLQQLAKIQAQPAPFLEFVHNGCDRSLPRRAKQSRPRLTAQPPSEPYDSPRFCGYLGP